MREKKDKKHLVRKFYLNTSYDLQVIETYLEEMAAKGYLFVERKGFFYYFQECEPQYLKFCVDAFQKASVFDTKPEPLTEEYIEVCESAGWKYLWSDGKLQIFYSEKEDVVPLHTDSAMQLKTIHKNFLASEGVTWLAALIICMNLFVFQVAWDSYAEALIINWYFIIVGIAYALITCCDVIRYVIFYLRNRARAKENEPLLFYSRRSMYRYLIVKQVLGIGCMALMAYGFVRSERTYGWMMIVMIVFAYAIFFWIEGIRNRKKSSRSDNIAIVAVTTYAVCVIIFAGSLIGIIFEPYFAQNVDKILYYNKDAKSLKISGIWKDEIPFGFHELGINCEKQKYSSTEADLHSSYFGSMEFYSQKLLDEDYEEIQRLEYDVIKSEYKGLLESHVNYYEKMGFEDVTDVDGEFWNAEQVLYTYCNEDEFVSSEWLLVYENVVFRVRIDDVDVNEEVKGKIRTELESMVNKNE